MQQLTQQKVYKVMFIFSGEGGGAKGAQDALPALIGDDSAKAEVIGGIDVDLPACRDFEMWTGVKATQLDLFDRDQYIAWHGHEPPADWHEATPDDLRRAAGYQEPDVVIITAPCKGFSGLLGTAKAKTAKYEALNRLAERGLFLALETWKPKIFVFENVKGMKTRGAKPLAKIKQLLAHYKYLWHDAHYDCGEWGGLAQHRKRFKGFARLPQHVPAFLYKPVTQRVKAIGEVLELMPLPIDPDNIPLDLDAAGGQMHMLPRLQWKTWVRLALIPPGGDWRDLQKIQPGEFSIVPVPGMPKHFDIVRTADLAPIEYTGPDIFHNVNRIRDWDEPAGAVTSSAASGKDTTFVADPRLPGTPIDGNLVQPHMTDPNAHPHKYFVQDMEESGATVTASRLGSGMGAISEHRIGHTPMGEGKGAFLVQDMADPSGTVTGDPRPGKSGGASVVADPRLAHEPRDASMRVGDFTEPSGPVLGSAAVTSSNGMGAVADPRLSQHGSNYQGSPGLMGVNGWDDPSKAVTGSASVSGSNTPAALADPRYTREPRSGVYAVQDTSDPARTVVGGKDPNGNMAIIAEPRTHRDGKPAFNNMLVVSDMSEPAQAVTAAAGVNQSGALVADHRMTCTPRGNSKGPLGVQEWEEPAATVTGTGDSYTGATAVCDPRPMPAAEPPVWDCRIPLDTERGAWFIRSPHVDKKGRHCCHIPMTTLQLLAIQGFPTQQADGSAVVLAGKSDRSWRERIGNAWPPPAAAAIISNILMTLLASEMVGWLWDYQQTGVLVLPEVEEERETA